MRNPLAVYIHWPFCKSKCPYCDFNSHVRNSVDEARWRRALLAELEHMASLTQGSEIASVFFGGGTPSLMPPATAAALIARAHELWAARGDIEITLEANPTSVEARRLAAFRDAGVNRVSLGVQALSDADLAFLGRGHSAREALAAVELAAALFARYSFDLIYARPGQTLASWKTELRHALSCARGHLSLYQLTIEENTAFYHAYRNGGFTLPDEELCASMYEVTETLMQEHGMPAYEVSNYAVPGQESRHNLAYWRGDAYIGVGPGAHGRIGAGTARIATRTLKSPERWLESVERRGHGLEAIQPVGTRETIDERIMMGLRLSQGIPLADFARQTGASLLEIVSPEKIAALAAQDLIRLANGHLAATLKGRLVLSSLTAELLA